MCCAVLCEDSRLISDLAIYVLNQVKMLLIPEKHLNRNAMKVKLFSQLIFDEPFIWFLDVLRKVTVKGKGWSMGRQLLDILHLYILSFGSRRRRPFYDRQHHLIQLISLDPLCSALIHIQSNLQ